LMTAPLSAVEIEIIDLRNVQNIALLLVLKKELGSLSPREIFRCCLPRHSCGIAGRAFAKPSFDQIEGARRVSSWEREPAYLPDGRSLVALEGSARDQLPVVGRCGDRDSALGTPARRLGSRAVLDFVGGHELLLTDSAVAREALSGLVHDHVAVVIDHLEPQREGVRARSRAARSTALLLSLQDHADLLGLR